MRRPLGLALVAASLVLGSPAAAQDEELVVPPPPDASAAPAPEGAPGAELTAPGALPAPSGPAAPGAPNVEQLVSPLLAAAEADLAAGRNALALARTDLAVQLLPEGLPLRVRAEGLGVIARQRRQVGEPAPIADDVLAPLVVQADLDLRGGQLAIAVSRLDLVLARAPAGSPLRAQAEQMRAAAVSLSAPGPVRYAPPPMMAPAPMVPPSPPPEPRDPNERGTGEIVELYITAGMFGVLTGAYIPFVASRDTATATTYVLTTIGGAAVTVVSVLLVDLTAEPRTGVAPTISASIRFGFANGMLAFGLYEALETGSREPDTSFSLVWGGAAIGAALGVGLGFGLTPSVRDVRFVESVGIWGGGLGTSIALITEYEDPAVGLGLTLAGMNAGLLAGVITAATGAHPSTRRSLFLDLGFLAGSGVGAALPLLYYYATGESVEAAALGTGMLIGSVGGWILLFALTDGMDANAAEPETPPVTVGLAPLEGGGAVTVSGAF